MPPNMLFYVKQFLTFFFSKAPGKVSIMQFAHMSIKYSKKNDFRLKRGIAAIRHNCVLTRLNKKQCSRGAITTQTKALVEKFCYNWALKGKCHAHTKLRSKVARISLKSITVRATYIYNIC